MTDDQHEALQAAHIAQDLFDRHVFEHPLVQVPPALRAQAEKISVLMGELYQMIGREHPFEDAPARPVVS